MKDLQEVIAEKYRQITSLHDEIKALEKAKEIIEGSSRETEKPQSQPEMAAAILEEVGKPMHVANIQEQIKKRFRRTIKRATLGVVLFRYAQRGKRFYKLQGKPNTYGLIKWQTAGERAEATRDSLTERALKQAS